MVINRHAQCALCPVLSNDIFVEHPLDVLRLWHRDGIGHRFPFCPRLACTLRIPIEDLLAQLEALITDTYARTGNHTLYLVLIFSAERAS